MNSRFPLLFIWISFISPHLASAKADVGKECRIYNVKGIVRSAAQGFQIIQAEGTRSARTFIVPLQQEPAIVPYIDAPVTAVVRVTQAFDATRVTLDRIEKIELRVPDPIRERSGGELQSKPCPSS